MDKPGGAKGGFVVSRGKLLAGGLFTIDAKDVNGPILASGCYDIFTELTKPQLHIVGDQKYLIVVIPGRCQTVARFQIPDDATAFNLVTPEVVSPGVFGKNYITSSSYDPVSGNFFYISKTYNSPNSEVWAANASAIPFKPANLTFPLFDNEGTSFINLGTEAGKVLVDFITPDRGFIQRMALTGGNKLTMVGWANIPNILAKAVSFVYISPYLYLVTYEPAGKVARLHSENFCAHYCGTRAFCNKSKCDCEPNYSPAISGSGCELTIINQEIIKERKVVGTAAVMGVLFVLTTIIAFVGWRSWYQNRQLGAGVPLVREYNRPL